MLLIVHLKHFFISYWMYLVSWVIPLVFLPLVFLIRTQTSRCGYMLLVMSSYWVTEAIPLGATGLIPVVLAPLLGIMTLRDVCNNYLSDPIMFFTGAIVIALAAERCNLHRRIALTVLVKMGTQLKWLLLGFTLTTCLISVFVTNTATTAMMLPIVDAILEQLENIQRMQEQEARSLVEGTGETMPLKDKDTARSSDGDECIDIEDGQESKDQNDDKYKNFGKCLTLMASYAAKCGGVAALTGSSINVVMKGFADQFWQEHGFQESTVTYSSWLMFGLPVAITNILIIWLWMSFYHLGLSSFKFVKPSREEVQANSRIRNCLMKEKLHLGDIKFSEYAVSILFLLLVLLWFFRVPGFMEGWGNYFQDGYIGPATPTILVALLLFAIPSELKVSSLVRPKRRMTPLMDWDTVHKKMPWSLVFLMGGGFALADACEKSGLSYWIGSSLSFLVGLNSWLLIFLICIMVCFLTEVISNAATCSILMPIVYSMANTLGKNPLYLMLPVTVSTAFAFMLPVSSPQNALSFSSGRLRLIDMAKSGVVLNILCAVSVTIATQTYGYYIYDFGTSPWAVKMDSNMTTSMPT